MHSLFPGLPEDILEFIPQLKHIFLAVQSIPDEIIREIRHGLMASAIMAQKKGVNLIKLTEDLVKIFELFPENSHDRNLIELNLAYAISVSDSSRQDFMKAIEKLPPKIKANILTSNSRIKEESKIEGKIEVILSGFKNGLDNKILANFTDMTENQIFQILKDQNKIICSLSYPIYSDIAK